MSAQDEIEGGGKKESGPMNNATSSMGKGTGKGFRISLRSVSGAYTGILWSLPDELLDELTAFFPQSELVFYVVLFHQWCGSGNKPI